MLTPKRKATMQLELNERLVLEGLLNRLAAK
jgi:hypothetical protein